MPPSWRIIGPQLEKPPDGFVCLSSHAEEESRARMRFGHPAQFVVGGYDAGVLLERLRHTSRVVLLTELREPLQQAH
jgi:hypothetical protein